ncbi:MAG: ABC transporter ATP-binding protein [Planctomycetota bacterium]
MTDYAVETADLSKTFPGGVVAVNGLDLRIPRGAVYGLIGRNGAGKTTAIRLMMGLLRPNGGEARILAESMWTAAPEHRARVAYVAQEQRIPDWMTTEELCTWLGHFYAKWDAAYARDLAGRFGLAWDRQVGVMSGGERRKVAVLLAFAARPDVLLLDEPAAGLDPIARRELIDEIINVITSIDGCTVLLSTHIISDLERIAEYIGIIDRGRIVTEAKLEDLRDRTKRVQIVFDGDGVPESLKIPGAIRTRIEGPVVTAVVQIVSDNQFDELRKIPGVRLNVFPLSLEDIFIDLFGPASREEFSEEIG